MNDWANALLAACCLSRVPCKHKSLRYCQTYLVAQISGVRSRILSVSAWLGSTRSDISFCFCCGLANEACISEMGVDVNHEALKLNASVYSDQS